MFTKQHYKRVAQIISIALDKQHLFNEFCKMFEEDNPNFDKPKFAEACGV